MDNIVKAEYDQTGKSIETDHLGMREMQTRAYEKREAQYLLIKAPPASGKSRALMFVALDKLQNQSIKKVIVVVPERVIGKSFAKTDLRTNGFFTDWSPNNEYDLCIPGSDYSERKIQIFKSFLNNDEKILICTHSTFRRASDEIEEENFDNTLIAIDEFHHISADTENNRLGNIFRSIIKNSDAHIVAMTGTYFRGDRIPILLPEDEALFTKVNYNYYDQLNGYKYLKSLGIGHHFYQGKYTSAIQEVLDTNKKTILYIPNVNSYASTKDKYKEVDLILGIIGEVEYQDKNTGVIYIKTNEGRKLKVADLVYDFPKEREKIVKYLQNMDSVDDMDLIIALGMAKEGFDWPYCEHVLMVGYRSSLREIVQIIGRTTRDSENKTHAQFTNLIAQPDASDDSVTQSVNNILKAIAASLLMEDVLAPNWNFKTKRSGDDGDTKQPGGIEVNGYKEPSTKRVKEIIDSDLDNLKATIFQDDKILKLILKAMERHSNMDPVISKVLIPKIIRNKYPDLSKKEVEEVRQYVIVDSVLKTGTTKKEGDKRFITVGRNFINIEELHIDLIEKVNPFQKAFEVLSKSLKKESLKVIKETIEATRIDMDWEEAAILWPQIKEFFKEEGREPSIDSDDSLEKRMAEGIIYLKTEKRKRLSTDE